MLDGYLKVFDLDFIQNHDSDYLDVYLDTHTAQYSFY